jgi:hypothetical protein
VDLVYICKNGDNEELRYSIRSAVQNLPHSKIWVVGGKPEWYSGNFIEVPQSNSKYTNVRKILEEIRDNRSISEKFVLMNDDFFVIKPLKKVPNLHGGKLIDKVHQYQDLSMGSGYTRLLEQTYLRLIKMGIEEPLDYDIHVPMIMSRKGLREALKGNTLWRSTYGNVFSVGGKKISDVKVYSSGPLKYKSYDINNIKYDFISTEDNSFEMVKEALLEDLFPMPSEYELDSKN